MKHVHRHVHRGYLVDVRWLLKEMVTQLFWSLLLLHSDLLVEIDLLISKEKTRIKLVLIWACDVTEPDDY